MTNPNDPDSLRRDIEQTQRNLSTDVDMLTEKMSPGRIAHRRMDRAREAVMSVRNKIMGSSANGGRSTSGTSVRDRVGAATSTAGDRVGEAASSMREGASTMAGNVREGTSNMAGNLADTARETPDAVRRGTEGNPLAAGLIAFGAGWLLSSLVPASRAEQHWAEQAKDQAKEYGQPVADRLGQAAQEVKENLRDNAQHAVESVRSTATDAAGTVKEEARHASSDVTGRAQQATHSVRDHQS